MSSATMLSHMTASRPTRSGARPKLYRPDERVPSREWPLDWRAASCPWPEVRALREYVWQLEQKTAGQNPNPLYSNYVMLGLSAQMHVQADRERRLKMHERAARPRRRTNLRRQLYLEAFIARCRENPTCKRSRIMQALASKFPQVPGRTARRWLAEALPDRK
jgi:hypothetical protein